MRALREAFGGLSLAAVTACTVLGGILLAVSETRTTTPVASIATATQTASEVKGLLAGNELLSMQRTRPHHRFFVTDEPHHFIEVGERFLGDSIRSVERVNHR